MKKISKFLNKKSWKFDDYKIGKSVKASNLIVGKMYFVTYKNMGNKQELFKFTGFSDAEQKYGESGPKFKTLKDAFKHYGLKNMHEAENMDSAKYGREYGQSIYMCGEWEDGSKGCFYYPYNGKWVRGSGADKLTFFEAIK